MARHDYHFVRNREFWTLYLTMIVAALAWGAFWAVTATYVFRLNRQALTFLVCICMASALSLGVTIYIRLRFLVAEASRRVFERELDLDL
ncbi:MAG TPA: hypothetical protein VF720_14800 [Candidatus Eisenbacteria bacterium]